MKVSVDELVDRVKAIYTGENAGCLACRMGNGTGIVVAFDRLRFVVAATAFVRR